MAVNLVRLVSPSVPDRDDRAVVCGLRHRAGEVITDDDDQRAQRDAVEGEVVGDLQDGATDAEMIPAAIGTRLTGSAKSTLFSFQIFAPSRPIIP